MRWSSFFYARRPWATFVTMGYGTTDSATKQISGGDLTENKRVACSPSSTFKAGEAGYFCGAAQSSAERIIQEGAFERERHFYLHFGVRLPVPLNARRRGTLASGITSPAPLRPWQLLGLRVWAQPSSVHLVVHFQSA